MDQLDRDCESELDTLERIAPAWDQGEADRAEAEAEDRAMEDRGREHPYGWGAFSLDCAITFQALEQKVRCARENESDENRVRIYARLVELQSQLRQLLRETEALTSAEIEAHGSPWVIEGLGEVASHLSADRQVWDIPALVSQVVARAIDEPGFTVDEDGSAVPPVVLAQRVADRITEVVKLDYGRIKAAKAHGIDASRYRTFAGDRRKTVQLPKAQHE